jgi:AraC-like DNA-binding protein
MRHAGLAAAQGHHANARMPMADVIALFQSAVVLTGRWIAGVGLPLLEVSFLHGAPPDVRAYEEFLECPVHCNSAENALVFSKALLDMPLVQADETLHLAMRAQAQAAAVLHMSPRSLQRRLGETDLRFQGVLDAVRKDMAVIYLRDPGLSILDVTLLLGYAEQSSFTRAFKGWFAVNPSAWRRAPSGPVGALALA